VKRITSVVLAVFMIAFFGQGLAGAQEATPAAVSVILPVIPDPSQCPVTNAASVQEILDRVGATPAPAPAEEPAEASPTTVAFTLPEGQEADQATVNEITQRLVDILACFNAGNYLALYEFATDNYIRTQEATEPFTTDDVAFFASGTPIPMTPDVYNTLVAVGPVLMLSDGRVGAVVRGIFPFESSGIEADWLVFAQENGRWLLDEEVDNIDLQDMATPST